jgi:hypothetical protein
LNEEATILLKYLNIYIQVEKKTEKLVPIFTLKRKEFILSHVIENSSYLASRKACIAAAEVARKVMLTGCR